MRVRFDRFVFDSEQRTLLDGESEQHVGPKAFQLLDLLLREAPRAISKKELIDAIWPDTFVNDSNLPGLVNELRAALGDSSREPRFVRTVHGFGYSFAMPVEKERGEAAAIVLFQGREHPLAAGRNILGRDPAADVFIDDVTVSRRHASITIAAGTTIEDLDSKNGTFVRGAKISAPQSLADGETFVLGDATILFRASRGSSTVTINRLRSPA